jgi:hypothetical protein
MSVADVPLTDCSLVLNELTGGTAATCHFWPFQCSMSGLSEPLLALGPSPTAHALPGDTANTSLSLPHPEVGPGVIVHVG